MNVKIEKEGKVVIFTINRPEVGNAINLATVQELSKAMIDFRNDDDAWVAIITGEGKAFCSGADIKDFLPVLKESRLRPWVTPDTHNRGLKLYKPIIGAINGVAYGGGLELALGCDIRVASETARFGQLEVTVGMMPGWGGTQRLPRLIPFNIAAEMIFTGKPIDAQEAYRIGLVNRVVPADKVMETAKQIAADICKVAPLAVWKSKEAMLRGTSMSLEQGLDLEDTLTSYVTTSEDFEEGIKAYKEKRKPVYKGR